MESLGYKWTKNIDKKENTNETTKKIQLESLIQLEPLQIWLIVTQKKPF